MIMTNYPDDTSTTCGDLIDGYSWTSLDILDEEPAEIVIPTIWRVRDADRRGPAMRSAAVSRHPIRFDRALPQHRPNYRQRRRSVHHRM